MKNTPQALASKTEQARRVTQKMHENEYQQALVTIKDKIRETEGPDIKETMMDQIRQWFIECRYVDNKIRNIGTADMIAVIEQYAVTMESFQKDAERMDQDT